jgi:hypothetical protein
MRPKTPKATGSDDLFRATLDQIINVKHELVQLAGKVHWDWIDGEIAPLYSENGQPGIETGFMIGLLLLSRIERQHAPPVQVIRSATSLNRSINEPSDQLRCLPIGK